MIEELGVKGIQFEELLSLDAESIYELRFPYQFSTFAGSCMADLGGAAQFTV